MPFAGTVRRRPAARRCSLEAPLRAGPSGHAIEADRVIEDATRFDPALEDVGQMLFDVRTARAGPPPPIAFLSNVRSAPGTAS